MTSIIGVDVDDLFIQLVIHLANLQQHENPIFSARSLGLVDKRF